MAGHAPEIGIKPLPNAKVAIISSSWHLDICNDLIAGAQRAFAQAQVKTVEVQYVPGSFEIPLAAQYAFEAGFDAVVAVGLVLKGETPHFDYVCDAATSGLTRVQLDTSVPIGFGLLTVANEKQALDRAGLEGSKEDKGAEAVEAAIMMKRIATK